MCIRERPCLARARLEKAGKLSRFVFPKGKNSNNLSAKLKDRRLRRREGKRDLRTQRGGGGGRGVPVIPVSYPLLRWPPRG